MYPINIKEAKSRIREQYKEKRKNIPPEEKEKMDIEICKRFLALSSYRFSDTVLLYSPLKNEIDTGMIVTDALSKGKKVAYPRCLQNNEMVYHYINSLSQLVPGKYGISEPEKSLPVYTNGIGHTICVLPGVVYDKRGYRLGYGKGYYDRFLSSFKGIKAGLIYSDFIIDEIPKGKYDLPSDIVVTEKRVISFAEN